jgi:hypothetical protein
MDLRSLTQDLQKIKTINSAFLNKLGEITIIINNNPQIFQNSSKELILLFIKTLQNFLCHNFYLDFVNAKNPKNLNPLTINDSENMIKNSMMLSTYDNSMNLILVISAKISKLNLNYAKCMIESFIDHLTNHSDCFNYVISFYRLYTSCSQIKQAGKECSMYNNLFELYKTLYRISYKYEKNDSTYCLRDIGSLDRPDKAETSDANFFLENYINLFNDNSEERDRFFENFGQSTMNYFSVNRSYLNSQERAKNNGMNTSSMKISNVIKFPKIKAVNSKTDRKNINKHLSNDFGSAYSMSSSILNNQNESNNGILTSKEKEKIKIPELKFPVNSNYIIFNF